MSVAGLLLFVVVGFFGVAFLGALAALGVFVVMKSRSDRESAADQGTTPSRAFPQGTEAASSSTQTELDPATLEELRMLIEKNQILNAIRLYRETTGASLDDATSAVMAMRDSKTL